jgi:uncharacterized protein (TIGR00251 family)
VTLSVTLSSKANWYRWQDNTLFLQLHVQTRTRRDEFKGLLNNRLNLRIKALPVDAKANHSLLALIAKEFNVCKSRTELIKGLQSRDKCVAVHLPKTLPDWFLELTEKDPEDHGNF